MLLGFVIRTCWWVLQFSAWVGWWTKLRYRARLSSAVWQGKKRAHKKTLGDFFGLHGAEQNTDNYGRMMLCVRGRDNLEWMIQLIISWVLHPKSRISNLKSQIPVWYWQACKPKIDALGVKVSFSWNILSYCIGWILQYCYLFTLWWRSWALEQGSLPGHPMSFFYHEEAMGNWPQAKFFCRKYGVHFEALSEGKNANAWSQFTDFTEEQLKAVNESIDEVYTGFLERVSFSPNLVVSFMLLHLLILYRSEECRINSFGFFAWYRAHDYALVAQSFFRFVLQDSICMTLGKSNVIQYENSHKMAAMKVPTTQVNVPFVLCRACGQVFSLYLCVICTTVLEKPMKRAIFVAIGRYNPCRCLAMGMFDFSASSRTFLTYIFSPLCILTLRLILVHSDTQALKRCGLEILFDIVFVVNSIPMLRTR